MQRNDGVIKDLNLIRQQNVSFVNPVTQLLFVPALKYSNWTIVSIKVQHSRADTAATSPPNKYSMSLMSNLTRLKCNVKIFNIQSFCLDSTPGELL